jgi:hypothetical protein
MLTPGQRVAIEVDVLEAPAAGECGGGEAQRRDTVVAGSRPRQAG